MVFNKIWPRALASKAIYKPWAVYIEHFAEVYPKNYLVFMIIQYCETVSLPSIVTLFSSTRTC